MIKISRCRRRINMLASLSPGTTAATPSFRVGASAAGLISSLSPASRVLESGPWQRKQFRARIGRISVLKSSTSVVTVVWAAAGVPSGCWTALDRCRTRPTLMLIAKTRLRWIWWAGLIEQASQTLSTVRPLDRLRKRLRRFATCRGQ